MARNTERPTREAGGMHDDYVERHPAYAMIGASRVTHTPPGKALFGSDFRHQHYMTISIRKASLRRGLSNDWYSGEDEMIEVGMSEAQWATFVSATNVGFGVPCTIEAKDGQYLPAIAPIVDRTAQFAGEVNKTMDDAVQKIDEILASGKVSKAIARELEMVKRDITSSVDWVARQFDEHMEGTVEKAKSEIEAYVVSTIHNAGLEALTGKIPPLRLAEPEDEA
jgi:hypothetical protein